MADLLVSYPQKYDMFTLPPPHMLVRGGGTTEGPLIGGSDHHFPRILEANPHFLRIFKILTFLTFFKILTLLVYYFQNPHFPRIFILSKVDTRDI